MRMLIILLMLFATASSCIVIGPFLTDRYVNKTAKSFAAYENTMISNLEVELAGESTTLHQKSGKIVLVSLISNDSLVNAVNQRLQKAHADPIVIVKYKEPLTPQKDKNNPFLKKGIFNALLDPSGKIIGTNVRKIPNDSQCRYYLDYLMYVLKKDKESITLSEAFSDYKWSVIFLHKWGDYGAKDSNFRKWLEDPNYGPTIDIWNKKN